MHVHVGQYEGAVEPSDAERCFGDLQSAVMAFRGALTDRGRAYSALARCEGASAGTGRCACGWCDVLGVIESAVAEIDRGDVISYVSLLAVVAGDVEPYVVLPLCPPQLPPAWQWLVLLDESREQCPLSGARSV